MLYRYEKTLLIVIAIVLLSATFIGITARRYISLNNLATSTIATSTPISLISTSSTSVENEFSGMTTESLVAVWGKVSMNSRVGDAVYRELAARGYFLEMKKKQEIEDEEILRAYRALK